MHTLLPWLCIQIFKAESECVHTLLTWLCIQVLKAESECVHTLLTWLCIQSSKLNQNVCIRSWLGCVFKSSKLNQNVCIRSCYPHAMPMSIMCLCVLLLRRTCGLARSLWASSCVLHETCLVSIHMQYLWASSCVLRVTCYLYIYIYMCVCFNAVPVSLILRAARDLLFIHIFICSACEHYPACCTWLAIHIYV